MSGLLRRLWSRTFSNQPRWIEPTELNRRLEAGDQILVLDVRGPDEFIGPLGHIDGAVNVPLTDLSMRLAELTADPRPLVMVCLTDKRSARAADELAAAGHRDVAVLRGGMDRWGREAIDG